jgi:3-oxoacyl-[acyl-carrier protein] reductase
MNFRGAVALVTGAGRGIGKAIAGALAGEGATVVLASRTRSELEMVQREIESNGGSAIVLQADITDDEQVNKLYREIESRFHRLDILVNNAGIGFFAPIKELSIEQFDAMWNLNMRALFLCTQKAIPIMQQQRRGAIVNVASLAGKNAFIGGAGYSATKWALMGFSKTLLLEVRDHNIRVLTVCPGSVDTSFDPKQDPLKKEKILQPHDVADTVLAALKMPERAMVSEIDIRPTNPR